MPSPASPLAARPSSVDAGTAADLDWRSAAGTSLLLPPLLQLASILQAGRACRAWSGSLRRRAWNHCSGCDGAVVVDVLVVGEVIGKGGGVAVAVAVAAAVAAAAVAAAAVAAAAVVVVVVGGAAAVVAAAVVVVVVGVAAVVGDGRRDYSEADWGGGTRGGIVEVGGVVVDGPTSEIGEDNRMGTFVDHGRNRKKREKSGVVAVQGAWMVACRCGREIGREGFGGVVVADVSKLAVGSSSGRLDVEA